MTFDEKCVDCSYYMVIKKYKQKVKDFCEFIEKYFDVDKNEEKYWKMKKLLGL